MDQLGFRWLDSLDGQAKAPRMAVTESRSSAAGGSPPFVVPEGDGTHVLLRYFPCCFVNYFYRGIVARVSAFRRYKAAMVFLLFAMDVLFPSPGLFAQGFGEAIETVTKRVVKLYGLGAGSQAGYGSGILISDDGLVLTVNSLLIDARQIKVVMPDGTRFEADVLYRDPQKQLALLRLKLRDEDQIVRENQGQPLRLGPFLYFDLETGAAIGASGQPDIATVHANGTDVDRALSPGDWVVAAGNAFKVADGAEPVSVAHGVFSGRTQMDARRRVREFPYRGDVLVIDAVTSNPGASGGAVVDFSGRLVGMIGRDVISNLTRTHFNYAVPRDVLSGFFQEALSNPECRQATPEGPSDTRVPGVPGLTAPLSGEQGKDWDGSGSPAVDLGIRISRTGYRTVLPFVERVRSDSPAARAGLRADDLVLSINGTNVADVSAYDERMKSLSPGEAVELVIRRNRRILNIRVEGK